MLSYYHVQFPKKVPKVASLQSIKRQSSLKGHLHNKQLQACCSQRQKSHNKYAFVLSVAYISLDETPRFSFYFNSFLFPYSLPLPKKVKNQKDSKRIQIGIKSR